MSVAQLERRIDGDDTVSVGRVLKEARLRMGLTQAELGERTKINVNSIAKYERAGEKRPDGKPAGVFPPWPSAHRLCKELRVDPARLFAEADNDQDDFRRRVEDDPSVADVERARELLIEAARLMGGKVMMGNDHSTPARPIKAFIHDAEPDEGPEPDGFTGSPALDRVVEIAEQEGPNAEAMPEAIEEAEADLKKQDVDLVIDMATPLELPIETFPSEAELDGLSRRARRDQKQVICERLIVAAVYGHEWENLSTKGFEQLSRDLGAILGVKRDGFFASDEPAVIDDEGLFESEFGFRSRALDGLRPRLIEALRLQDAPEDLDDRDRYPLRASDDDEA